MDQVRFGDGANFLGHHIPKLLDQLLAAFLAGHQRHVGIDTLALHIVLVANHGSFGNAGMQYQGGLDLGGAQAVAGDVEYVVHPTGDPVVTILVATGAVTGEVVALVGTEIGINQPLVIAIDGTDLAGPAGLDGQIAGGGALQLVAVRVHQHGLHPEHGQGGRAGFQIHGTRQRRDHDGAGFGLPPGIHDGTAGLAHHLVIPLPGFRVDRFAYRAQQLQAGPGGFGDRLVAQAHEGANGGGCGVEDIHLVLVHHLPAA